MIGCRVTGRSDSWRGTPRGEESHGPGGKGDRAQGGFGCVADGEGKPAAFRRLPGISVSVGSGPSTELVNIAAEEPRDHLRRAMEGLYWCEEGGWHQCFPTRLLGSQSVCFCVMQVLLPFHPHTERSRDLFHIVERQTRRQRQPGAAAI